MKIEICGRDAALARVAEAEAPIAVVSITSTDEADVVFPPNKNLVSVLRLRFNDLTEAYDEEGIPYGRPLPKPENFEGLKDYVDALDCERLIVQCWEGVSRSAAVAAAINAYHGGVDQLVTHGRFAPNPRVYMMACCELGIRMDRPDSLFDSR